METTWQSRCRAKGGVPLIYQGAPACRMPDTPDPATNRPRFRYLPADLSLIERMSEQLGKVGDAAVRVTNSVSEGIGADKGLSGVLGTILTGNKNDGVAGAVGKVLGIPKTLVWVAGAGLAAYAVAVFTKSLRSAD